MRKFKSGIYKKHLLLCPFLRQLSSTICPWLKGSLLTETSFPFHSFRCAKSRSGHEVIAYAGKFGKDEINFRGNRKCKIPIILHMLLGFADIWNSQNPSPLCP